MMAVVEVSWEDQFGTRHTSSAKLEDASPSGACLRVRVPVAIGSAMKVTHTGNASPALRVTVAPTAEIS
jgi:hypothetical protein